jgi:dTDP-4-dehydrorhamnose reductase
MLGRDLVTLLERDGTTVTGVTRQQLDITDAVAVRDVILGVRPGVVVNCAAWTAVDDAEEHEADALAVNGHGAANLAAACAAAGARMVQMSTDYVFAGTAYRPYPEDDSPAPRTAYGRTKLAGEEAVRARLREAGGTGYIVRTAWLYGEHGANFVRTMIRLAGARSEVSVVNDQHGQPTWTSDVARQIITLIQGAAAPGVYHATSSGETTWFGFAREVFRLLGADPGRVTATASSALDRPAPRPAYSVLGHDGWSRAGIDPIADWRQALRRAFPALAMAEANELGSR